MGKRVVFKWIVRRFMLLQVLVYRRSGGKRMGHLRGMPVILLNTVGRRTGKRRVTPVMYTRTGESFVVTASNNGADEYPGWFLNLKASPSASIEVDGATMGVTARQASAEERGPLWAQLVSRAPFFEGYTTRTKRDIPMLILRPAVRNLAVGPARREPDISEKAP